MLGRWQSNSRPWGNVALMVLLSLIAAAGTALADGPKAPLNAVQFLELPRLSQPKLSPSGRYLSYVDHEMDWEANERKAVVHVVDLSGQLPRPFLRHSPDEYELKEAHWLDDDTLLLTLEEEEADTTQVYRFSLLDQSLQKVTDHHAPVKSVVVAGSGGFYFRARAEQPAQHRLDLEQKWAIREYETKAFHELWFADLTTGDRRPVLQLDGDIRDVSLSLNGRFLLYSVVPHTQLESPESELWRYDVQTQQTLAVSDNDFRERDATISPMGDRILYIAPVDAEGEGYYERNLFLHTFGSEPELLLPELQMEIQQAKFSANGEHIYLLINGGLRSHLYRYTLSSKELTSLTKGDSTIKDWHYSQELDRHSYRLISAANPGEIWTLPANGGEARQVTQVYAALELEHWLPQQREFVWRGPGGQRLEGLLALPSGHRADQAVPLITMTHGGPRSSAQFGSWNTSRAVSVFTGEGYAVFLPNHRGGTGYGDRFLRDMVGKYFRNAHRDVLSGIDALVDAGIADPTLLVKMGWSAGGHMTNKLITHTQRFAAASSGAGVSDWNSLYAESDIRRYRGNWFGGAPWDGSPAWRSYARQSPLRRAFKITTPTLFFVGEKDVRVPPTQAIGMYRAAKAAGAETQLYVAPGQPHGFRRPSYQLFKINTELSWFAKQLNRPAYHPEYPAARSKAVNVEGAP